MPQLGIDLTVLWWVAGGLAAALALTAWWVWRKGRAFAPGDVFRASRFSAGNRLFPTQVLITSSSVVQFTPRWVGRQEETIHLAHVSSVKINTGVLLSDVLIETSGGSAPIRCSGHTKGDATRMKALIEQYQNQQFRVVAGTPGGAPVPPSR